MADLLSKASAWLADQRVAHLSRTVTYSRGGASVSLPASVGSTSFDIESSFGVEQFESRDYLVRGGDLLLNGESVEPQAGDVVREAVGGRILIYEVMAPGQEPCWRWSDPYRTTLRVHTKQIGSD